jgi:hypothetical protein
VTPEAHCPFLVERKILDVVGMIAGRPMAVFTLHPLVRSTTMRSRIVLVTFETRSRALVLDRKVLPLLDVPEAMIVVGEAVAVHAKVIRHHKQPGEKNKSDYPYCDP